jgi:hypothetical protein
MPKACDKPLLLKFLELIPGPVRGVPSPYELSILKKAPVKSGVANNQPYPGHLFSVVLSTTIGLSKDPQTTEE